jgi:tungstate transport system ATP-binding protein
MVFQKPVLLRRSVAANIDFVLRPRGPAGRLKRDRLLRQAGLEHKRDQPARLLSGGEQQKLALARALATEPRVLFLDEPCASIDSASTAAIEDRLRQCREAGMKIVMVTHDIGQARRLADEVLFLHRGKLLEHQPAPAFFEKPASPEARGYIEGKLVF